MTGGSMRWLLISLIGVGLTGCQPSGRDSSGSPSPDTSRATPSPSPEVPGAVEAVRSYYRAIDGRRYRDAYLLWGSGGAASGKSFDEFRSGFSATADVEVRIGAPGPLEAAAGSRYVEIPVRVIAGLRDGTMQEFEGTYTMRRSVVDGATPEQQAWHIYTASLRAVK